MAYLKKGQIERKVTTITLDAAGGANLDIRELTGKQAYSYQLSMVDKQGNPDFSKMSDAAPRLISMSALDENGKEMWSQDEAAELPQRLSDELVKKINEANGIAQPEEKKDSEPET